MLKRAVCVHYEKNWVNWKSEKRMQVMKGSKIDLIPAVHTG
jgi:hypothetical protein